ncbi:MAG TPA: class I SAM-dependent methyltransferase [Acidimicrobiia bacterium]|nr:class I SAM-dependent methyltransferase [Acidimicrobiia bacterium]
MNISANNGPTDPELRLLGDLRGKRVLDLGCGTGSAAIAFAQQGAIVIALDPTDARLARARARAEQAEVKVEWRTGDLADLAFLRAESIDAAFASSSVAEVDDAARLFRQVQRVLKPNGAFVFSYAHPMSLCIDASGVVTRSYFDPGPIDLERDGDSVRIHVRDIGDVFTELGRAGFRVDTIVEPKPSTPGARIPDTIVWRARKEGA